MRVVCSLLLLVIFSGSAAAQPSGPWLVRTSGASGPVTQVALPDSRGRKRTVFIALEYARQCDPLFSFIEISGDRLGTPISQEVLTGSKIGIFLNGKFYTWHATKTTYNNGFEAALGIQNELALQLLVNVDTRKGVTPDGERIPLPVGNFSQSFQSAVEACRRRLR
mgnify:CR=1 FL=1